MKKKILFLVFVLLSLFGLKYVYDMHINHNFEIITEGKVYKSGVIPPDQIADYVSQYKIKSIIDLRFPGTGDDINNPEIPEELIAEKKAVEKISSKECSYQIVDVSNFEIVNTSLLETEKKFGKIDIKLPSKKYDFKSRKYSKNLWFKKRFFSIKTFPISLSL